MPGTKVRTTRPLNLTSDVVLRPTGPLDAECAAELRVAVEYLADRAGGPIVVDCTELTSVSEAGAEVIEWFGAEVRDRGRVALLRHVAPEVEAELERSGTRARFDDAGGTPE